MLEQQIRRRLPIPSYYSKYINVSVDLNYSPKQCCPFHKEDTPSFSYSPEKQVWRCFGACKTGGDVIELHRMNYKLSNRAEALSSLASILGIKEEPRLSSMHDDLDKTAAEVTVLVHKLNISPKNWLALDEAMSYHEPAEERLIRLQNLSL